MTVGSNTLYFAYDANGTPMSVTYNGTNYYYATNLQGDVTAILNSSGTAVVTYTYDAWGKLLTTSGSMASTLGEANPLRYRGYVYDQETGLYYLQSRYYDPEIGRFINADGYTTTGQGLLGSNMFAYCNNNPIISTDTAGSIPVAIVVLGAVAVSGIYNYIINTVYYEQSDGESDLTPSSYTEKAVTREEQLDYVKQQTGEEHYNINAWRYYSEYSFHKYGWYATSWAYGEDMILFSWMAQKFQAADVWPDEWDERWYVNLGTLITGLFGF